MSQQVTTQIKAITTILRFNMAKIDKRIRITIKDEALAAKIVAAAAKNRRFPSDEAEHRLARSFNKKVKS